MGSATTQGRPATRADGAGRVAFRLGDGIGALIVDFRSSIPSPSFPCLRFTGHFTAPSAKLSREALSSSAPCRFSPAHHPLLCSSCRLPILLCERFSILTIRAAEPAASPSRSQALSRRLNGAWRPSDSAQRVPASLMELFVLSPNET